VIEMINNTERLSRLKETQYQGIFGVKKQTFEKMLEILEAAYQVLHAQGGKPPKLSVLDKLVITLMYYREYRTFEHIAFDYGVSKSTICESVGWVEETLVDDEAFALPAKRVFEKHNDDIEIIVVDVTEQDIQRPKRGRKNGTRGRKSGTQ